MFFSKLVEFLRSLETDEQRAPFLLTEADIAGFAKSDPIAKLLAISQILYLGITCFARLSHKVPISLLELMTTTYILVSALMYYFWWHKPYDARYVTVLFSPGSVSRSVECGPSGELPFQHGQPGFNAAPNRHGQHFALNEQLTSGDGNPKRVKKGTFQYHDLLHLEKENVSMVLIYVCCLTLSASNGFLALPWAWSTFPSPSMQYAWNTASGFAMVFPASFPVFFCGPSKISPANFTWRVWGLGKGRFLLSFPVLRGVKTHHHRHCDVLPSLDATQGLRKVLLGGLTSNICIDVFQA